MSEGVARQIGTAFALSAFAVAIVSGLVSGADAGGTLTRSLVVLLAASAIGRVFGVIVEAALNEHLTRTLSGAPIPEPISLRSRREPSASDAFAAEQEPRP